MAGKNPQMEKLKAMREMAKAKSALSSGQSQPTQTQQQSPKFTASEISSVTQIKKSPNSSNDGSPMEETGPKIPEVNIHGNHRTGSSSDEPPYDIQRRRQEQLMARRMMNALNDEPASPQPATPPFSPQPNNQYNPMVNPWPGSGNPPPEAVAAAQEMVNILLRNYYVILTQFRCWMH